MASVNKQTLENMIKDSVDVALKRMIEKKWDKIYVMIDIHNTIFKPCYHNAETFEWFENAQETLQFMTNCNEICLILWTSSYDDKIQIYIDEFEKNGIHFDYVNENPEVTNDDLGCYDKKLYFNIGIDDKFGFNANTDWTELYHYLKNKKWKMLI